MDIQFEGNISPRRDRPAYPDSFDNRSKNKQFKRRDPPKKTNKRKQKSKRRFKAKTQIEKSSSSELQEIADRVEEQVFLSRLIERKKQNGMRQQPQVPPNALAVKKPFRGRGQPSQQVKKCIEKQKISQQGCRECGKKKHYSTNNCSLNRNFSGV